MESDTHFSGGLSFECISSRNLHPLREDFHLRILSELKKETAKDEG